MREDVPRRRRADRLEPRTIGIESSNGVRKRSDVPGRRHQSRVSVGDNCRNRFNVADDGRVADAHRFEQRHRHPLGPRRKHEHVVAGFNLQHFLCRLPAKKGDAAAGPRLAQPLLLGSRTHDRPGGVDPTLFERAIDEGQIQNAFVSFEPAGKHQAERSRSRRSRSSSSATR